MTYINFDINKGFKNFIYEGSANNATLNIGFAPDFINYTISETEGGFNAYSMLGSGLLKGDDDGFVSADANAHKHMTANGAIIGNSSKVNIHNHQCHATAWNAGGNNQVVNSTGTITANVCANTTTGFSTGTYTGNQSDTQTIGHGLSKKPELVWVQAVDGDDGGSGSDRLELYRMTYRSMTFFGFIFGEGLSSSFQMMFEQTDTFRTTAQLYN